jgi:para-nitrobenzyl esterase
MRTLWKAALPLVLVTLATGYHTPDSVDATTPCLVDTQYGMVQGQDFGLSCAFFGVPYAAAPIGNRRWQPPMPAVPWAPAVLPATAPAAGCPSIGGNGLPTGSEDCLRLNIWVSAAVTPAQPAPVLVWLHTGAFIAASNNFSGTNGRRFAEETGVIVVAPNYRLGPFGFLAHEALENEDPGRPSSGNYGLLDQRAALEWVRDNITQFGGDADNVTLGGTSAGGQSTGLHLVAPGSEGLFDGAIIQSAYPTTGWATRDEAVSQGEAFAAALGCTDPAQVLDCMHAATRDQVLTALPLGAQQVVEPVNRVFWEPIVDGLEIPEQPRVLFEQGDFHHVPTLLGWNRDEGWGQFLTRSFPAGVTDAQYVTWVMTEFGDDAAAILGAYPAADYASPAEALARVVGDGQFRCEARRLADLIADGGLRGRGRHEQHGTGRREKVPVFLYSYEYELDVLSLDHVIHGVESNIVFGNNYVAPPLPANHVLTAADLALHEVMAGYWSRFITAGDPNPRKLRPRFHAGTNDDVFWPEYRKNHEAHIVFDAAIGVVDDTRGETCAFWSDYFFRSMLADLPASSH